MHSSLLLTWRFGEPSFICIYIYENKIELCKIFIISHLSDIKMQFAFRKFSKKSKREVVVSKAAFYGFSKIACNLNVIYFSIYALKDLLFFGACACVHECKLLVIFFDFSLHNSKVKQSILKWNENKSRR